jgi:hypothetical protein
MKLQIDGPRLRLRLAEDELARLLRDRHLEAHLPCPNGGQARRAIVLEDGLAEANCDGDLMDLRVRLPLAAFLGFTAERPRRDGFSFAIHALEVSIEVDVRDSRKRMQLERENKKPR